LENNREIVDKAIGQSLRYAIAQGAAAKPDRIFKITTA
jgi:hypothetical protein